MHITSAAPLFHRPVRLVFALLLLGLSLPLLAAPSNKWRIEADGRSKVDGQVEFAFTPEGGGAIPLVVDIPARTRENDAARLIRDAVRSQFGEAVYHAEIDDGEDVLVKAKGDTPDFDLSIVRNTAAGLKIELDRE
ncbi:hypothetical protein CSC70_00715 [Pseudoxanthomonas kalamensis DSM 18571]|uniref:hypothetical protein n=1 Tax=Pseudoxanthomonas kalamensis TaxID=289483 RepID=UPI001390BC78|nr:hypothetical protein [Pseudoxanthomonas kalamensis]KAF1712087.1 hypothetical protein CSC70_00715 [Pseudoxanthomonas kalamensis DSM 18571]